MVKKRMLIEDDMLSMNDMQIQIEFCIAELLLRSDLLHTHTWSQILEKPEFHDVAISGDYNDLTNKPVIPTPIDQVQSDWAQTDTGEVDFIKNKPMSSFANPSRSVNSVFRPNEDKDCFVAYALNVTTTAALLAGARARLTLQYADNSGMNTNLINVMVVEGGTGSGIAVTSYHTLLVVGMIPAGKYVRLVTENVQGTPTYGTIQAHEVSLW